MDFQCVVVVFSFKCYSFYQCKDTIGKEYCIDVCENCCDPMKLLCGSMKNVNIGTSIKPTTLGSINPCQNQFVGKFLIG